MKFLEQLSKKPRLLQRLIGLSPKEFMHLQRKVSRLWDKAEEERLARINRKRARGAGRSYAFKTTQDKLFVVLIYLKAYPTQELLACFLDVHQTAISRLVSRMRPILEEAADPELKDFLNNAMNKNRDRIDDWQEFLTLYPELRNTATDATEQKRYRSQNKEKRDKSYSGKRKQYTLKTQISVGETGKIIDVSNTYSGSVHDKKVIDLEGTIKKLPQKTAHYLDLGYKGVIKENPDHYLILPIKKSKGVDLSREAKELNRAQSMRRIKVENAIARIKQFRIFSLPYRGPIGIYNQIFRSIAALCNLQRKFMIVS